MPARIELSVPMRARRASVALAASFVLLACSTTEPVTKHTEPSGIQLDASGFTVTEAVHVGAETHAEFDSAMRLLEEKQYDQGIAMLIKVTQSAPAVTAPYVDLGIAYSRAGDLDKAEASLKRAVELNPRHPIAYNELGMVYRRKGQFAAARANYEKALGLVPEFHFARLNLAILCDLYVADPACALDNYTAYQQAVPDDKQAAMWIADLRARANR